MSGASDDAVAVCVTHMRFVPCRSENASCWISTDPSDVEYVRAYQTEGQR